MTRPSSMPKIVPNPPPGHEIVPNPNPLFKAEQERRVLPTLPPSTPPLR